jgi:hypothetical protein
MAGAAIFGCGTSSIVFSEPGVGSALTTTGSAGSSTQPGSTGGTNVVTGPAVDASAGAKGGAGGAGGRGGAGGNVVGDGAACNRDCPDTPCARLGATWRLIAKGTTNNAVSSLAIGPDALYVGTTTSSPLDGAEIDRVPLAGGPPTPVVLNVQATELLVDGDWLFYVDNITHGESSSLRMMSTSSGDHVTLASDSRLSNVRVDALHAYYSTVDTMGAGRIMRIPRAAPMSPPELVVETLHPWGFAIDGDAIYWTRYDNGGTLFRRPLEGGATTTLATSAEPITNPVAQGLYVYFLYGATPGVCAGSVMRVPKAGGMVERLSPGNTGVASQFGGLVIDSSYEYWAQIWYEDGWLLRRPHAGGDPELLLTGQIMGGGLAVSETDVYFVARPDLSSPYEVRAIRK